MTNYDPSWRTLTEKRLRIDADRLTRPRRRGAPGARDRSTGRARAEHRAREIGLRACVRIGELTRELDRRAAGRPSNNSSHQWDELTATKAEALAEAGISTSAAHRYEELAGGRELDRSAVDRRTTLPIGGKRLRQRKPPNST